MPIWICDEPRHDSACTARRTRGYTEAEELARCRTFFTQRGRFDNATTSSSQRRCGFRSLRPVPTADRFGRWGSDRGSGGPGSGLHALRSQALPLARGPGAAGRRGAARRTHRATHRVPALHRSAGSCSCRQRVQFQIHPASVSRHHRVAPRSGLFGLPSHSRVPRIDPR